MRTEKLAGMGRLSTAVAHEIRNPLSAITQANALLDEDVSDPRLKKLTAMVSQNAKRLEKIVNDVLNVSRVQPYDQTYLMPAVPLDATVQRACEDWAAQSGSQQRLTLHCETPAVGVRFDTEHLRRVLVNLLDNARRYTEERNDAIQVFTCAIDAQHASIAIWSDAAPMDQSVERHLFEPFFSSDSRSSGLGLFICRELCERHDLHWCTSAMCAARVEFPPKAMSLCCRCCWQTRLIMWPKLNHLQRHGNPLCTEQRTDPGDRR